jgi:5'-deoxynucleotidase YfbR-like HD superfamily hydrolase
LKNLPNSKELLALSKEYQKRKTLEAKIAKDADLLDEILLLKEYEF